MKPKKNILLPNALVTALLVSASLFVMGVYVHKRFPTFDAMPLFFILLGALAVLCIGNRLAMRVFVARRFGMSAEERDRYLQEQREACAADPAAMLREVGDVTLLPLCLLVLYHLLVLAMSVACGMAESPWVVLPCYLLFMSAYRLMEARPERLNVRSLPPSADLPLLHELAQKAADTVGLRGRLCLDIADTDYCGVRRIGRTYVVTMGTRMLSVCTEAEIEQLLLREFELWSNRGRVRREHRIAYLNGIGSPKVRPESWAFDLFFSHVAAYMAWNSVLYDMASAYENAHRLAARIRQDGNPRADLNRLAKAEMWQYFSFEFYRYSPGPYYASPEPRRDSELCICRAWRRALTEQHATWGKLLEVELPSSQELGVSLRDIRHILGLDGEPMLADCTLPNPQTPYGQMCLEAIRLADARVLARILPDYEEMREREYLHLLNVVEEWEASDKSRPTSELSPVINAYRDLERWDEAEAVCDTILATEQNPFAQAHALYFKGIRMLYRYETEGIDLIYRSMDINKNYMQNGLELVETYCCLCGLSDELATNRRRALHMMEAHGENQEGAGTLTPADHLVKEDGLGELTDEILAYMLEVSHGCLERVYLVRKVISEDFFTSVFVLYFAPGSPREQMQHAYEAIFNYLDSYHVDWQFSLFVYDRTTEMALKKVPEALLWEREPKM